MCSTAVEFHAAFVRVHSLVFCGKYRNIQKCNWSKCLKFLLDYRFASAIYLFSRNVATESNLEWNEESFGRNVLLILSTHFLYPSERRAKWDKQSDPFKMKRIVESTFLSWPCIYFPFLNLVLVPDSNQTLLRSSSYQQELGLLWRIPPRWWVVSCSSPCLQSNVLEINQIVCCLRAERL